MRVPNPLDLPLRAGLLAGALALGTGIRPPAAAAQAPPASADTGRLMATVRALAADSMEGRRTGTPGGDRARRYLIQRLEALGLAPVGAGYEYPFTIQRDGTQGVNLVALLPGSRPQLPCLVLSAHYDHLGSRGGAMYPGADDNASGVAAVLEIAAALKDSPLRHPVLLLLFDAEERGEQGARAFLAEPPLPRERLGFDLNLDMVSHSASGVLWAAGSAYTPWLRPLLDSLVARASVTLKIGHDRPGIPGEPDWTGSSDHAPFHTAGIPFLYFGVEDHADYHRPSDTPETVTVPFFGRAVATILEAVRMLDRELR